MSLLKELGLIGGSRFYKYFAPNGATNSDTRLLALGALVAAR